MTEFLKRLIKIYKINKEEQTLRRDYRSIFRSDQDRFALNCLKKQSCFLTFLERLHLLNYLLQFQLLHLNSSFRLLHSPHLLPFAWIHLISPSQSRHRSRWIKVAGQESMLDGGSKKGNTNSRGHLRINLKELTTTAIEMTSFEKWTSGEKNRQKQIVKIHCLIVCLEEMKETGSQKKVIQKLMTSR